MSKREKHFYEFGPFQLDPSERQLRRNGELLPLTPKAFDVLLLLIENSGHALRKEEFLERVWADSHVEEKNLADNISVLRKVLGDDSRAPSLIQTVPRVGYRFVAVVRRVEEESIFAERTKVRIVVAEDEEELEVDGERVTNDKAALGTSDPAAVHPATIREPTTRRSRTSLLLTLALVLLVCTAFAVYFVRGRNAESRPTLTIKSLAVLPFKPLNAAERDEALELGMADSLITRLSSIRELVVRPTNAVRSYTDLEGDPFEIGRRLEVESVLEGHIQRAGDRVRVTVRLVRVAGGEALWASQFDEKYTDIFGLQDSISERVAAALVPQLSSEEARQIKKRYTEDAEAYRFYLLGRFFWNRRTPEGFEKAIDFYKQAVATDPNYALAHAGLAETYVLLPNWTTASPEEMLPKAEQAGRRALELDPALAEAYTALAAVKIYLHRDWKGAGEDYRRAIELKPNYATAHQWYAEWLASQGNLDEALAESAVAQRLDPLSPIISFSNAVMLYMAGRMKEAEAQARRALELEPALYRGHTILSRIYFDQGLYELSFAERALALARGDQTRAANFKATLAGAFRTGGREGYLRKHLELLAQPGIAPENRVGGRLETCARLGDKECTFDALKEAEQTRHPLLDTIKVDPYFDFVRPDPRYAELMRKLGLE